MKKEIEVQVKADREVLALTTKLLQTNDIESRYRIFLETLGAKSTHSSPQSDFFHPFSLTILHRLWFTLSEVGCNLSQS